MPDVRVDRALAAARAEVAEKGWWVECDYNVGHAIDGLSEPITWIVWERDGVDGPAAVAFGSTEREALSNALGKPTH